MQEHLQDHGTFKKYLIGFSLSLLLTLLAFFLGAMHPLLIGVVGLLQAWILLFLFLGLGKEQWNLLAFLFTIMVTLLIVLGSIWIMYHLNYNLMMDMHG